MRPDLCAIDNNVNPRDYIGKFWIDALTHDEKALQYITDVMGTDRVCMGSDYPFPLGEHHPGKLIESVSSYSQEVKDRLLRKNALDWMGLAEDHFG